MPIGSFRLNTLSAAMAASGPSSITATGGTESFITIGATTYKRHLFAVNGTASFVVSAVSGSPTLEAVLVGGGGASGGVTTGTSGTGGGGGAGQYALLTNITPTVQTYSLSIGMGGQPTANRGGTGSSTTAFGTTVIGGGGGGGGTTKVGASGGAAGGGGAGAGGGSSAGTSTGTYGGGSSVDDGSGNYASGGGGGSAQAGSNGANTPSNKYRGRGGNGTDITSWYGATQYVAAGGNGGGSTGPATQPLGSGSYGSGASGSLTGGGAGNEGTSGAVIIRYPITPVTTMELVTSKTQASSSSANFVIPTGGTDAPNYYTTQAGDIAILFDSSTTTTDTIPSGWTRIGGISTTGMRQNISYKVLNSTEAAGSIIVGMAGASRKVMLVYRPNATFNSITITSGSLNQQATTAAPTAQSLVSEAGPVITFAAYSATGAIFTRGWSVGSPTEYSIASTSVIYVKALITNSGTPTTTSITMSDGGTNALQSFSMKFI